MKSESSFWPLANKIIALTLASGAGFWGVVLIVGGIAAARDKRMSKKETIAATAASEPGPAAPPAAMKESAATPAVDGSKPVASPAALAEVAPGLQAQLEGGQKTFMTVCIACHQATGMGLPNMFPPLVGTDWVSAPKPDRMIRIVLHGLMGPMSINGKPFTTPAPLMPPQGAALSDAQIADVLTFVRNSWGNKASAVSAAEVAAVRVAEKTRSAMWTEAELLKVGDR